jgi:hypothetical protein
MRVANSIGIAVRVTLPNRRDRTPLIRLFAMFEASALD